MFDSHPFQAFVSSNAADDSHAGPATVRLSKHSCDREQVSIVSSDSFDSDDLPCGHWADYNQWSYDNGALTIEGGHPAHGEYQLTFHFIGL